MASGEAADDASDKTRVLLERLKRLEVEKSQLVLENEKQRHNYAKSLVSEALPQSWLFIQGGLFILVVTALPEGVIGWFRGDGPRNWLNRFGIARRSETYPRLDLEGQEEVQS